MSGKTILMLLDNPLRSDQRVEKEARSLSERGFSVMILATDDDDDLPKEENRDGYTIRRILSSEFKHPLRRSFNPWLESTAEELLTIDFSIVHCHDFALLPLAVGLKKARPEVFFSYDSHEYLAGWPYYREIPNLWSRIKGYFVWKRFLRNERRASGSLNAVICPSVAIAEKQQQQLQTSLTPLVIRNIPQEPEGLSNDQLRSKLGIDASATLFVHAGNIHAKDADIDRIVESIIAHPGCHVLFIGNRPRFFDLKKRWAKNGQVHFQDYDPQQLIGLLAQCSVGIAITETRYLAHRIGSSNRMMEYTKAGLPILASEQESHEALKEHYGHVVLCKVLEQDAIEQAVEEILSKHAALSLKAHQASGDLVWDREVRPLINLYKSILGL